MCTDRSVLRYGLIAALFLTSTGCERLNRLAKQEREKERLVEMLRISRLNMSIFGGHGDPGPYFHEYHQARIVEEKAVAFGLRQDGWEGGWDNMPDFHGERVKWAEKLQWGLVNVLDKQKYPPRKYEISRLAEGFGDNALDSLDATGPSSIYRSLKLLQQENPELLQ